MWFNVLWVLIAVHEEAGEEIEQCHEDLGIFDISHIWVDVCGLKDTMSI